MAESRRPPAFGARGGGVFPPGRRDLSQVRPTPLPVRELPSRLGTQLERRDSSSRQTLVHRVRAEFDEMRGLRLSLPQAGRLFGLREDVCVRILNTLEDEGFLKRTTSGLYGRRDVA
jgi:hypothetical protein